MRTGNNPGLPDLYFVLAENATDHHAHGGRPAAQQPFINKRVQVLASDHPRTDRWVSLTTVRTIPALTYRVGVVDGLGRWVEAPTDYPTARRARNAANRLLTEMENDK
jgi:hypothetical protein